MGASGWDYRAPYAGSIEAALIAVQEQVLMSGDYIWPWDDIAGWTPQPMIVKR